MLRRLIIIFYLCGLTISEHRKICGSLRPKYFDPTTEDCKNGKIIEKPTPEMAEPTHEKKPDCEHAKQEDDYTSTADYIPTPSSTLDPMDDVLDCHLSRQPGKSRGLKCCGGFQTYHPQFDTCCYRNDKDAVRHKNKPEGQHICCTGFRDDLNTIYRRGSKEFDCLHPSLNDGLFANQRKLKLQRKLCADYNYAYIIRIRKKIELQRMMFSECYNATITRWPLNTPADKETFTRCIPIDKYTPNQNNKVIVLLSNHDHKQDLDFYIGRSREVDDMVFKGPKKIRKLNKRIRKFSRRCQNSKILM